MAFNGLVVAHIRQADTQVGEALVGQIRASGSASATLGLMACDLSELRKNDSRKQAVAWLLRKHTTVSNYRLRPVLPISHGKVESAGPTPLCGCRALQRAFFRKQGNGPPRIGTVKLTIGDQPRAAARLHAQNRGTRYWFSALFEIRSKTSNMSPDFCPPISVSRYLRSARRDQPVAAGVAGAAAAQAPRRCWTSSTSRGCGTRRNRGTRYWFSALFEIRSKTSNMSPDFCPPISVSRYLRSARRDQPVAAGVAGAAAAQAPRRCWTSSTSRGCGTRRCSIRTGSPTASTGRRHGGDGKRAWRHGGSGQTSPATAQGRASGRATRRQTSACGSRPVPMAMTSKPQRAIMGPAGLRKLADPACHSHVGRVHRRLDRPHRSEKIRPKKGPILRSESSCRTSSSSLDLLRVAFFTSRASEAEYARETD